MNICKCGHHLYEHHSHYVMQLAGAAMNCMAPGCDCANFRPAQPAPSRPAKTFSTQDKSEGFVVGDIITGIQCGHPFLDMVGDTGVMSTRGWDRVAEYIVVNVVCNPETNEAMTKDVQIYKACSDEVGENPDALCFLHSEKIPCAKCAELMNSNYKES